MICSPKNSYKIVTRSDGASGGRNLLVRDAQGKYAFMVTVGVGELADSVLPLFLSLADSADFPDFIECFNLEGRLCAVFSYRATSRDLPLERAMQNASPSVRAEAMRSLIGVFMENRMPYAMMCDVLRRGNLLCTPAGRIRPIYDITPTAEYDRDLRERAMFLLAEAARIIFSGAESKTIMAFIEAIERQTYETIDEVYAAYMDIADELAIAEKELTARAFAVSRIRNSALLAVIGILAAALVFFTYKAVAPPPSGGSIEIGTVVAHDA